jgi:reactive intermediate/imine deaminase
MIRYPEKQEDSMRLRTPTVVLITLGVLLALSAAKPSPGRSYVRPSLPGGDDLPFSGAVRVGDTLYLSGALGLDENRKVPEDPTAEARLVLTDISNTLKEGGMSMDDLVFVQVFCSDVKHYAAFNGVYRTFFKQEFPARAFVGSGRLLFDARFEVQAIAVKR